MAWPKPRHRNTNSKVDWAGMVLISKKKNKEEKEKALAILDNWRAIHRYPMHIFKKRLKRVSERLDNNAFSVQRLKRLPSVLKKLKRVYSGNKPTMKLSQMQDIAGCRAVMRDVNLTKKLYKENYMRGDIKHKRVNMKDYISNPKEDGYRCIHLIYRYKSDKERKKDYNGLLVEIQIRSKLQHLWATAIETVDFFTRQAIKSNEGQKEWTDFFRLVSSAFAIMESTPPVPNTPDSKSELYSKIKEKEKELQVIKIMGGWATAVKVFEEEVKKKPKLQYFLLELDILSERLYISGYTKNQEEQAVKDYAKAERRNQGKKEYDVVLVGADTTNDLKQAYPNYFVDTKEFLENLKKVLKKSKSFSE